MKAVVANDNHRLFLRTVVRYLENCFISVKGKWTEFENDIEIRDYPLKEIHLHS